MVRPKEKILEILRSVRQLAGRLLVNKHKNREGGPEENAKGVS